MQRWAGEQRNQSRQLGKSWHKKWAGQLGIESRTSGGIVLEHAVMLQVISRRACSDDVANQILGGQ